MGAMTDVTYNVQMNGMYNSWPGGTYDVMYDEQTDGDFTGISCG